MEKIPNLEGDELGWSIEDTSRRTSECTWTVKQRLRAGEYKAKKSGRRTIVIPSSVRAYFAGLPDAHFAPPRQRAPGVVAEKPISKHHNRIFKKHRKAHHAEREHARA
jgi:hypothetical protein